MSTLHVDSATEQTRERIVAAYADMLRAVHLCGYADAVKLELDPDYTSVRVSLVSEGRSVRILYALGHGYMLTADGVTRIGDYFQLGARRAEQFVSSLPVDGGLPAPARTNSPSTLAFSSIVREDDPDDDEVSSALDSLNPSESSIDSIRLLTTLRSFEATVERLRTLVEAQRDTPQPESVFENIIANSPWLLGSMYRRVEAAQLNVVVGSRIDLLLISITGFVDVVEVKRPDMALFRRKKSQNARHHGDWMVSPKLAEATAQGERYLRAFDEHHREIRERLERDIDASVPLRSYRPRCIIVGGRTPTDPDAVEKLREWQTKGRISILTYDDVLSLGDSVCGLFRGEMQARRTRARWRGDLSSSPDQEGQRDNGDRRGGA